MRVSRITMRYLAEYLRLEYEELSKEEIKGLRTMLDAARAYVKSYTGLDDSEINVREDITIAVCVLVQDMYDNRTLYVDGGNVSKTVETILNMHSANLL